MPVDHHARHHARVTKLLAVATAVVPDGMDEAQRKATQQEASQAAILACLMIVKHGMLQRPAKTPTWKIDDIVRPGPEAGSIVDELFRNVRGATRGGFGGSGTATNAWAGGLSDVGVCAMCGLGSRAYDPFDPSPDPDEKWVVAWRQVAGGSVAWRQVHVHERCFDDGCRECWATMAIPESKSTAPMTTTNALKDSFVQGAKLAAARTTNRAISVLLLDESGLSAKYPILQTEKGRAAFEMFLPTMIHAAATNLPLPKAEFVAKCAQVSMTAGMADGIGLVMEDMMGLLLPLWSKLVTLLESSPLVLKEGVDQPIPAGAAAGEKVKATAGVG